MSSRPPRRGDTQQACYTAVPTHPVPTDDDESCSPQLPPRGGGAPAAATLAAAQGSLSGDAGRGPASSLDVQTTTGALQSGGRRSLADDSPMGQRMDLQPLRTRAPRGERRIAPHRAMSCCERFARWLRGWLVWCHIASRPPFEERFVALGSDNYPERFPRNVVRNQKYSLITFFPLSLYEQFKFFFNMYFLAVTLTQFYPPLQVGFLFTYVSPLAFVVCVSLLKEAYDDIQRCLRDRSMNSEMYEVVQRDGRRVRQPSRTIGVGTVLRLGPNQRVPADCVLLHTTEKDGSFIRTDQLDGETDWKLRQPIPALQALRPEDVVSTRARLWCDAPHDRIYDFVGRFLQEGEELDDEDGIPLTLENTLWANCILATGHCTCLVVYTGCETRACLNAAKPSTKLGLIDLELNFLSKVLFFLTILMALALVALQRFRGEWYITLFRFVLLFSSIIPISLRVNLDMGKVFYSFLIYLDGRPPFAPTTEERVRDAGPTGAPRPLSYEEERLKRQKMPGVAVRNTSLPEELGRIGYLFSDKTGTLTRNDMIFRKMFTGGAQNPSATGWFHTDASDMRGLVREWYAGHDLRPAFSDLQGAGVMEDSGLRTGSALDASAGHIQEGHTRSQMQAIELLRAVTSVAVTHNVTPVTDPDSGARDYQASSPDEVALVRFAESVGVVLESRDRREMTILIRSAEEAEVQVAVQRPEGGWQEAGWTLDAAMRVARVAAGSAAEAAGLTAGARILRVGNGDVGSAEVLHAALETAPRARLTVARPRWEKRERYAILSEFPFTSESKRMGIILRHKASGTITFFMKGADVKMVDIVRPVPWLDEQCKDLAREGLRTLVFGARDMTNDEYIAFDQRLQHSKKDRDDPRARAEETRVAIEQGLELVAITGVEDRLQEDVALTLECLRNGGIKVWMLTGDKVETAICIARSTQLVSREGRIFPTDCMDGRHDFVWEVSMGWRPEDRKVGSVADATDYLRCFRRFRESQHMGAAMVVDGETLDHLLRVEKNLFHQEAGKAVSVIVARCSPTQKAIIVNTIRSNIPKDSKIRTAAIGDGGNDVSMILAADVGLGIEGKEGMHASLAADFSLTQFSHCHRLITWHGRNSYKRSARLSQFVIHRGLIISVIQGIFSAIFYFMSVPIYTGWVLVGYATVYTMFPVFAIVLDEDVTPEAVYDYPELYKELHKARVLNLRTFLQWVFKAVYQGGVIMLMAMWLFDSAFIRIMSITFTALIFTELITVWFEMHKFSWLFVAAEVVSLGIYVTSFFVLDAFDLHYIKQSEFWWKTCAIAGVACGPPTVAKVLERTCCEPRYSKIREGDAFTTRLANKLFRKKDTGLGMGAMPPPQQHFFA